MSVVWGEMNLIRNYTEFMLGVHLYEAHDLTVYQCTISP